MTWPNFKLEEFACPCGCGENKIDPAFVDLLQRIRTSLGVPMIVSSGYRCPKHNQEVSDTGPNGPHTTGHAADIAISRGDAYHLVCFAVERGITGLGINQKGDKRFVHLDNLTAAEGFPRPMLWSY